MYQKLLVFLGLMLVLMANSLGSISYADNTDQELDLGVYKSKFNTLDSAIKSDPKCMINYINKADLHLRFYQLEEARAMFENALKLSTDEVTKTYLEAAILYCDLKLDESAEKIDALLTQHPECKRSTFIRGLIALQKHDDKKALKYFEKVLELDFNYLEAMNQIAWIYMSRSDYDKAIEYFNQVLYRDHNYISALDGKGYALYKLGLHKEALPYVNEVIILLPDSWGAWTTKGEIYFSQGEYYLSNYCLNKAESINPDALEVQLLQEKLRPIAAIKEERTSSDNSAKPCDKAKDKPCPMKKDKPCDKAKDKPCPMKKDKPCDKAKDKPCPKKKDKPCDKKQQSEE